jgi:energy-coupling factor transport system ATP-binding protein
LSSSSPLGLAIDALSVRFPDRGRPALDALFETVDAGEIVALTGPSGCGKSTLLRTMAGFIPALIDAEVTGALHVGTIDVFGADAAEVAQAVGLVQQDPEAQICTLGVRDEVAFGPENLCLSREEVERRVDAAMGATGIGSLQDRVTTTLSGGEMQRVAIASILAMEPGVLLLDEPTAHLDPAGAASLFDTLKRLRSAAGRTLIVAEHRLHPLLELRPRLAVMDEGRIVARRPTRTREDLLELGLRLAWPRVASAAVRAMPHMRLEEVRFGYGDRELLGGLSLGIHGGEILGIIGPNGAGKTTLLRLLAGLQRPRGGSVERIGRGSIGMVFQHPHQQIFERTVRRELEIDGPLSEGSRAQLLAAARLGGLDDAPPLSLSLGEQRRLTVATALRGEPEIVLLDEPFIGQDRHNMAWIIARLIEARDRGAALALVSHDIGLVDALSDRILFLGAEPLLGPPNEVFEALRARGQLPFTPGYWEGA